jgi:hypothetical protein
MAEDSTKGLSNIIRIDDERIQDHLKHVVRGSVEATLNALLEAEADRLCGAGRYERTKARQDTRKCPGGIVIIDDYGFWGGQKTAVDTFFASRGASPSTDTHQRHEEDDDQGLVRGRPRGPDSSVGSDRKRLGAGLARLFTGNYVEAVDELKARLETAVASRSKHRRATVFGGWEESSGKSRLGP